jgi:hypothetical protein
MPFFAFGFASQTPGICCSRPPAGPAMPANRRVVSVTPGKLPSLEEFLPQRRRSQKSFCPHLPFVTSFFDLFDFAVNLFFKTCCFKHAALSMLL